MGIVATRSRVKKPCGSRSHLAIINLITRLPTAQASYRQVVAPDFVWVHDDGTLRYVASVEIQHDVREEEDVLDNVEDEPAYARAVSR